MISLFILLCFTVFILPLLYYYYDLSQHGSKNEIYYTLVLILFLCVLHLIKSRPGVKLDEKMSKKSIVFPVKR